MSFPKDFIWGVASAAYQTEGAASEDGRGVSIWDTFCQQEGAIAGGDTGEDACDGYHRFAEDIALAALLGVKAYRFSISWVRIDPRGDGQLNEAGLAYYDRVVDTCLAAGIEPYLTLFHWDLPQPLEDAGGWANPVTAKQFAFYAAAVAQRFAGRVTHYFTMNEPECVLAMGYAWGLHAPGKHLALPQLFAQLHGMLRAHALATGALHAADGKAVVGIVTTGNLCYPATETRADLDAARTASFATNDDNWMFTHQMVLDVLCFGRYPACGGTLGACIADVSGADLALLASAKPQLIGINVYNGREVSADADGRPVLQEHYRGFPRTGTKWPFTPPVLRWGPRWISERYGLPVIIAENGQSCNDRIFLDGKVHDADRIDFLHRYLLALRHACEDGADIRGYFAWSLTDNFEWHSGYSDRFGLFYVDYPSQRRIAKDSAAWYAETIRQNGDQL